MIGYVAKDADGDVYLYNRKPSFDETYRGWLTDCDMLNITNKFSEFDRISYKDEPIKVEIKLERI